MGDKMNVSNIIRALYDDNIALPFSKSSFVAMATATSNDENSVYCNDAISHITMKQWDKSIGDKFPIESSAKRMLSFDNNNTAFQNNLAKIFNISVKPTNSTPTSNFTSASISTTKIKATAHENYPKKRPASTINNDNTIKIGESGNVESTNENKFKTDFKAASGKSWDKVKDDYKIQSTTASSNNANSNTSAGTGRRNLGLSKPSGSTQTSSKSTSGFKPAMSIKKDIKEESHNDLPEIKGIEPKLVELILNEILDKSAPVDWDDVAGLEFAKNTIKEIIIWPMLRPDIFKGLRGPPKGVLLFGPPGTGKTLIGKCIAAKSKATFFSISASSLTSKWVGEGEKMVRSLFAVAKHYQPAVIFIDEIDSLLTQRCDGEHESSRRIKTEFLVQLDGCGCFEEERTLVIGATNRPQELDEAARRRLVKKLYIPLPEAAARKHIIQRLLTGQHYSITDEEIQLVVDKTEGYSGADVTNLCKEAAIAPLRSVMTDICTLDVNDVPPITLKDFESALQLVKSSVSPGDLHTYRTWNDMYGTMAIPN